MRWQGSGLCEQKSNILPVQIDPARGDIMYHSTGWMGGDSKSFSRIISRMITIEKCDYMVRLGPLFLGMSDQWGHYTLWPVGGNGRGAGWISMPRINVCEKRKTYPRSCQVLWIIKKWLLVLPLFLDIHQIEWDTAMRAHIIPQSERSLILQGSLVRTALHRYSLGALYSRIH